MDEADEELLSIGIALEEALSPGMIAYRLIDRVAQLVDERDGFGIDLKSDRKEIERLRGVIDELSEDYGPTTDEIRAEREAIRTDLNKRAKDLRRAEAEIRGLRVERDALQTGLIDRVLTLEPEVISCKGGAYFWCKSDRTRTVTSTSFHKTRDGRWLLQLEFDPEETP